jgi:hypothetical protein
VLVASDRDTVWRGPTMLRVGQNVLALEEPVADVLAELEAVPDEALPDSGAPPLPVEPGASPAPIASPTPDRAVALQAAPERPPSRSRRSRWSGADVAVVVAAISILVLSAAGLYWLLRG